MTESILPIMQLILTTANVCIMGYAFLKFLGRPHDNLSTRIANLEAKVKDLECARESDKAKDSEYDKGLAIITHSVIALIEFEVQCCLTENKPMSPGLIKAKDDLNTYLAEK